MKFGSYEAYDEKVHLYGRISLIVALFLTFLLPLAIWLVFGILPGKEVLIGTLLNTTLVMLPAVVIELISYAPLMGSSGMYMMTLSGSYISLRIPGSMAAISAAGVEPKTEEAEIFSTIGVGVSIFVSISVLIACVVLIIPLQPIISAPVLQPAFDAVLPALFGALTISMMLQTPKHCILPLIVAFLITVTGIIPSSLVFSVNILLALLANRILYKKKLI